MRLNYFCFGFATAIALVLSLMHFGIENTVLALFLAFVVAAFTKRGWKATRAKLAPAPAKKAAKR